MEKSRMLLDSISVRLAPSLRATQADALDLLTPPTPPPESEQLAETGVTGSPDVAPRSRSTPVLASPRAMVGSPRHGPAGRNRQHPDDPQRHLVPPDRAYPRLLRPH